MVALEDLLAAVDQAGLVVQEEEIKDSKKLNKMKRITKLIYIGLALLCTSALVQAQVQYGSFGYYRDALRFSQYNQWGTARFSGIGGSGSVLGGGISAATLNPAGLGLFNRSQFVLTPSLGFNTFDTSFEE